MKKIFRTLHLWLSIPFGLVITVICFSGAMLVFEPEITEWRHPSRYFAEQAGDQPLPVGELIQSVNAQLPDTLSVAGVQIPNSPKRNYRMSLSGQNRTAAVYVNPYSGEIKDMLLAPQSNFFTTMRQLHRWLLGDFKRDGSFSLGKTVVGVSTLLFVFILISGIAVWIPKTKKALALRLKIKMKNGWRRFWYDLHVAGGMYAAAVLLTMALTGLTWSFGWYRTAFYCAFGVEAAQPPHGAAPQPASRPERGGDSERRKTGSGINYSLWQTVVDSLNAQYRGYKNLTVQDGKASVSLVGWGNSRASDSYAFDAETGAITSAAYYKDSERAGKLRGWIFAVHVGSWGGMATRILAFLAALLGATLPLTGYYIWIRKKWKR